MAKTKEEDKKGSGSKSAFGALLHADKSKTEGSGSESSNATTSKADDKKEEPKEEPKKPEEVKKEEPNEEASKKEEQKDDKKEGDKKSDTKKPSAKKATAPTTASVDKSTTASLEEMLLFEHGIEMKGGVKEGLDFNEWRKVTGTAWKSEIVGSDASMQRISPRNMDFVKLIADTNKISLTQALNNVLAMHKYLYGDYMKKLQKEREDIKL